MRRLDLRPWREQARALGVARAPRVTLAMACLFGSLGMVLPFLSRWLSGERGLDGAEIGAVLSLAQLGRIGTGPLIAFLADMAPDRRTPIRILGVAALTAFAAFFFLAHGFWALLISGFCALSLSQALASFVEGAVLRATAAGAMPYGLARGLGSVSFIFASVVGGVLISRFGLGAVVVWVLIALATFNVSAWGALLPDPAPAHTHGQGAGATLARARDLLRSRRYLIVIIACGLIQAGHAFYYGFSTLAWRAQGISPETVGLLWACGVAAEVAFFWSLPLIEARMSPAMLILAGGLGAVVRWTVLGFAPTGFVLWPAQALHALSFAAAHVGAMRLIFRETPEASAGLAQTFYGVSTGGVLLGLSTLLSGLLYDAAGAHGYWAMSVLAACGSALALLLAVPRARAENPLGREPP